MSYHSKTVVYQANPRSMGGILDTVTGVLTAGASALGSLGPQFSVVGGIAKPTNTGTLELFKDLQRQLNRVAKIKGFAAIGVDGDIGAGTITAMQKTQAAAKVDLTTDKLPNTYAATALQLVALTAQRIATDAISIAANVKIYADQLGASSSVASPKPAAPPAVYNPATGVSTPQPAAASAIDAWRNMDTTSKVASVGLLGVAGYLIVTKRKKR